MSSLAYYTEIKPIVDKYTARFTKHKRLQYLVESLILFAVQEAYIKGLQAKKEKI